jgi:hypothetical protein
MKILNKSTNQRPIYTDDDRCNFEDVYTDFSGQDFLGFSEYPYPIPDPIPNLYYYDIVKEDKLRFDNIAYEQYSIPEPWWVIMHVNKIVNPFSVDTTQTLLVSSYLSYLDALRRARK